MPYLTSQLFCFFLCGVYQNRTIEKFIENLLVVNRKIRLNTGNTNKESFLFVTGTMPSLIALLCFITLVSSHPIPQRLTEDQFRSFDFGDETKKEDNKVEIVSAYSKVCLHI